MRTVAGYWCATTRPLMCLNCSGHFWHAKWSWTECRIERREEKSQTRRHVCEDSPMNAIFLVLVSQTLAMMSGGQDLFPCADKATNWGRIKHNFYFLRKTCKPPSFHLSFPASSSSLMCVELKWQKVLTYDMSSTNKKICSAELTAQCYSAAKYLD